MEDHRPGEGPRRSTIGDRAAQDLEVDLAVVGVEQLPGAIAGSVALVALDGHRHLAGGGELHLAAYLAVGELSLDLPPADEELRRLLLRVGKERGRAEQHQAD